MYSKLEVIAETGDPAFDLTTLQAVKDDLGITVSTYDDAIESEIHLFSKIIATYCDRTFAVENVTETFVLERGECPRILALSRYPVNEVYSVEIDGVEIDTDTYEVDISGLLRNDSERWWGTRIEVTYNGGYDLPDDAPAALSRACIEFIREKRLTSGRDPTVREIEDQGTRVSYWVGSLASGSQAFPPGVADLLEPFRRLAI